MVRLRNIGCWGWGMIGFNFGGWWSVGCRSRAIKNGTSIWGRCRGMVGSRLMVCWGRGIGGWGIWGWGCMWGRMGNIATVGVHIGGLVSISFQTGGIFSMFFIHTGLEN